MKNLIMTALLITSPVVFAKDNAKKEVVEVFVTENGFEPSEINVKPGQNVILKVTRKTDETCATNINVASKKIKKDLPLNKTVTVDLGKVEKGEVKFACSMNMIKGKIIAK